MFADSICQSLIIAVSQIMIHLLKVMSHMSPKGDTWVRAPYDPDRFETKIAGWGMDMFKIVYIDIYIRIFAYQVHELYIYICTIDQTQHHKSTFPTHSQEI